jgi:hypothetical protein
LDKSDIILPKHFIDAINITETLANDLAVFEAEMNKAPYERFADYIQTLVDSTTGKASLDIHALKKLGFISTTSNAKVRLKELITPAAVYDKLGLYTVSDDGTYIHYERIHKTTSLVVSLKPVDNSRLFAAIASNQPTDVIRDIKSQIAATTAYGFECESAEFSDLANLLEGNFAYSPFKFKDGVRGKSNIIGGTKWVVLDIDSSTITAEECHFMLADINHHIALSSDMNNPFKFRVLLELDSPVELDPIVWRNFYLAISADLSLTVDPVPQSQIFFSYGQEGRTVLSVTDADPIPVRDYLMQAYQASEASPSVISKSLSNGQKQALLADPQTTFAPAYFASSGEGSRKLIWAANYAYNDLSATKEQVIDLLKDINNYWPQPMPYDRLERTVLCQVLRWP